MILTFVCANLNFDNTEQEVGFIEISDFLGKYGTAETPESKVMKAKRKNGSSNNVLGSATYLKKFLCDTKQTQ